MAIHVIFITQQLLVLLSWFEGLLFLLRDDRKQLSCPCWFFWSKKYIIHYTFCADIYWEAAVSGTDTVTELVRNYAAVIWNICLHWWSCYSIVLQQKKIVTIIVLSLVVMKCNLTAAILCLVFKIFIQQKCLVLVFYILLKTEYLKYDWSSVFVLALQMFSPITE